MKEERVHTFHIPVLGLAFSIDTPIRVARFGISSVISLVDDILIEHIRKHYCALHGEAYIAISPKEHDYRARRITEYLDLVQRIVQVQIARMKESMFETGSDIVKYFEMLPDSSPIKHMYRRMVQAADPATQAVLQDELRLKIIPGAIDVNIMTKLNKSNFDADRKELPGEYSDALAGLRGFAKSALHSSVVLSAGLSPRLYSYLGNCVEFLPDKNGILQKKVILKVSDYRSALIQGKFLAKKGIWISEYRIESGLNCGGHAFATDGLLLGPILEEFKVRKQELIAELRELYRVALGERGIVFPASTTEVRITVQGGIGTANEDRFLREYHGVDGTGWGSPFLLVPEATNVDDQTRTRLSSGNRADFYLSDASPLGIPFNNLRGTSSEVQRRQRIEEGKPGSPCTKKYLVSNTEFTEQPICTASMQYQSLKIKQLKESNLLPEVLNERIDQVMEKACLCEDLAASGFINSEPFSEESKRAVAVCPGPNLAFFSNIVSLEQMVGHIYGRLQLLSDHHRPNLFINELQLYVDYLKREIKKQLDSFTVKEQKYFGMFKTNMLDGIAYYKSLIPNLREETDQYRDRMRMELLSLEQELLDIVIPAVVD